MHRKFCSYPIWPTKAAVSKTMPKCFTSLFPITRVIIDCTEIFIEKPDSVRVQSSTFSNYKHHNTAKGLVGITPAGAVSFISDLYTGCTSDRHNTKHCGIYQLVEVGDSFMADTGFYLKADLPYGVELNIPLVLKGKEQLSLKEERETIQISSLRIHVERAIFENKNIKTFKQYLSKYHVW